jgi:hypothetical protein
MPDDWRRRRRPRAPSRGRALSRGAVWPHPADANINRLPIRARYHRASCGE